MTKTELEDIEVNYGELVTIQHTFLNDDTGAAIDITGYTIYFTVKKVLDLEATDTNATIAKTASITDATNGLAETSLSTSDTAIAPGTYYYDMKYKNSGSTIVTLTGVGKFIVKQAVTNR